MAGQIAEPTPCDGVILCPAVLTEERLVGWKAAIDAHYAEIDIARRNNDAATITQWVGASERFVPTASSFTIGAVSSDAKIHELLSAIATGPAGAWTKNILGGCVFCNLDQSWVRRQYAPSRYPPLHAPHGWHQDGALKFDFLSLASGEFPRNAVLEMITCWIAIDPSGFDAPGLELVTARLERLFAPSELRPESVEARFTSEKLWRPILQPGDALLFRGDILHRTHVVPEMTKDRTSIELRFFPASIPERLQADRFIPFG
jgi:hypothetical protein